MTTIEEVAHQPLGQRLARMEKIADDLAAVIHGVRLLEGQLPRRALALVRSWAKLHGDELQRNWELARANRSLRQIAPLE